MRKRHKRLFEENPADDESPINLTPLIDVVFIVLIAFMLIAPLLDTDSITLAPSKGAHQTGSPQNHPISITLRADNTLWFQGKQISLDALEKTLLSAKAKSPTTTPQIIPDAHVHFETYQKVKNAIEASGFETLDVVLRP